MKEDQINSFAELHNKIESYGAKTMIYRGLKSKDYPLITLNLAVSSHQIF